MLSSQLPVLCRRHLLTACAREAYPAVERGVRESRSERGARAGRAEFRGRQRERRRTSGCSFPHPLRRRVPTTRAKLVRGWAVVGSKIAPSRPSEVSASTKRQLCEIVRGPAVICLGAAPCPQRPRKLMVPPRARSRRARVAGARVETHSGHLYATSRMRRQTRWRQMYSVERPP